MKLGLHSATYSGFFHSGDALTMEDIISRAARFGFDAVEILGRSPHGNPLEVSAEDRARNPPEGREGERASRVRRGADGLLACRRQGARMVPAVPARDHPSRTGPRVAHRQGLRGGLREPADGFHPLQQWSWAREGLTLGAREAEKQGVVLALHNHAPLVHSYRRVLEMIDEVGSPALKACIDPHCLWWAQEPMEEAVQACGSLLVHSHLEDFRTLAPQLEFYNPGAGSRTPTGSSARSATGRSITAPS